MFGWISSRIVQKKEKYSWIKIHCGSISASNSWSIWFYSATTSLFWIILDEISELVWVIFWSTGEIIIELKNAVHKIHKTAVLVFKRGARCFYLEWIIISKTNKNKTWVKFITNLSLSMIVATRWAMVITVLCLNDVWIVPWICRSVSSSTFAVASSIHRIWNERNKNTKDESWISDFYKIFNNLDWHDGVIHHILKVKISLLIN